ncbi:hypothetical protein EVAR_21670_1 [Eumeta japonica]|uniref:DUF7041 domain-containing protein n=1 Tax=Eumeta variegata TaxID=151549 RepID=A0A4C1VHQ1_EUMVA|nr:hypothetical protein EVAR_21670_1 [Eumeta japonica]
MAEKKQDDGDRSGRDYEDKGETTVNRISVRVPPFYRTRPSLWFASLESQFALAKITQDETKYNYAISQLEASYADIVDVIMTPPAADKYQRLKTELIKRLTASRERQVKQLLNHEELGDRKPSQFLRHLKHLAGPGVPDDFIRTVWISRLPSSVQTIIASQSKSALEEVSELADQIMDVVTLSQQITAVSANPGATSESNQIVALTRQVPALAAKLDRMSQPRNRRTTHQRNNL